jgi:hypothetical protein
MDLSMLLLYRHQAIHASMEGGAKEREAAAVRPCSSLRRFFFYFFFFFFFFFQTQCCQIARNFSKTMEVRYYIVKINLWFRNSHPESLVIRQLDHRELDHRQLNHQQLDKDQLDQTTTRPNDNSTRQQLNQKKNRPKTTGLKLTNWTKNYLIMFIK